LHTYALAGSYQVQLLGLDPLTGCSNLFELPLTISQSPDASFVLSDSIGCGYLDVNFIASTANLSWDYLWDFGNGVTTTQVGSTGYQFATSGCYDISLTVTNQQQCSSSVLLTSAVCIFEEAIADFSVSDLVLSSLEPIVQFYNLSMNASSYAWDFGDGTTSLAVNPTHVYSFEPASYLIVLTAFNEIGCIDTATLTITVWEDFALYVPNTFTPNDDEKNQVFLPIISGGYKRDSYHLMIFDRWGELVFESMDPNVGWDGFFGFHHQVCQDGTYTWKISLEVLQSQEVQTFVGHVNLLR
jgi:gliding motility-associated-like protein